MHCGQNLDIHLVFANHMTEKQALPMPIALYLQQTTHQQIKDLYG